MLDGSSTWEVIRLHPAVLVRKEWPTYHLSIHTTSSIGVWNIWKNKPAIGDWSKASVFSKQGRAFFLSFSSLVLQSQSGTEASWQDKSGAQEAHADLSCSFFNQEMSASHKTAVAAPVWWLLLCTCVWLLSWPKPWLKSCRAAELPRPPTKDGDWPRGMAKKWDEAALSCLLRPGLQTS